MKLLLVDGHYYVYRSHFAIRGLSNSRGEPTNAIYGFIKTLRRMVKDLSPHLAAVVWDEGLPERRVQLQATYKAQRPEMPADMAVQFGTIRQITPLLGFHSLASPNTEADDLMASYACDAVGRGHEVVLATNDKDLFQLVADGVKIYTTNKAELASPKDTHALLDRAAVRKKWGVDPERIGDVLCLIGDSVDNIPGVPGLGPKSASALIEAHGSIDGLLANLDAVKNEKVREKIRAARDQIEQNREMVRLDTDLALPKPTEQLRFAPRYEELIAALERCEFKSLLQELRDDAAKAAPPAQSELF